MKPSCYNCFYSIDETGVLGYNTFTTRQISLTNTQFAGIQAFYADPADDSFERSGLPGLRDILLEAGMLVPDDLDERARVAGAHAAALRLRCRALAPYQSSQHSKLKRSHGLVSTRRQSAACLIAIFIDR